MVSFKHLVLIHAMMSVFASASAEIVIMTETDTSSGTSTDTTIKIEEIESLSFEGDFKSGNLVVNYKDGNRQTVSIASIRQISMGVDEQADGIDHADAEATIAVQGDMLCVSAEGGSLSVYSVNGAKVLSAALSKGMNVFSLAALDKGVYLLHVNGKSVKFLKR